MSEPNGCPTPGACSAVAQIAALTKERDDANCVIKQGVASHVWEAAVALEKELSAAQAQIARLIEERNEWRSIATDNLSALQTATARIADAQAQILRLRADMFGVVSACRVWGGEAERARKMIEGSLAIPVDTSALDARLAAERERCVKACEAVKVHDVGHPGTAFAVQGLCIFAIRGLA